MGYGRAHRGGLSGQPPSPSRVLIVLIQSRIQAPKDSHRVPAEMPQGAQDICASLGDGMTSRPWGKVRAGHARTPQAAEAAWV